MRIDKFHNFIRPLSRGFSVVVKENKSSLRACLVRGKSRRWDGGETMISRRNSRLMIVLVGEKR